MPRINSSPTTDETHQSPAIDASVRVGSDAWAPLRLPVFRLFWIASLASNLGTWIHEIGAGWLMTELNASPIMVSAVRTSMSLPIVFLAIPAGTLADRFDKRRLLIATQALLFTVTALLSYLTAMQWISAWGLLVLTFLIGIGMVVHVPTWQSAVPELVPRNQISRAVALGSISFNLARAIGPAIGGLLIGLIGLWSTFAFNALSFATVIVVLSAWQRKTTESSRGRSFWSSTRHGVRYVRRHPVMQNVMLGVMLFVVPGSALWSLLPLFAKTELKWGAEGFGILVAAIGAGAVLGASVLPRWRRRLGTDKALASAMGLFAIALIWMSVKPSMPWLLASMLALGLGWMATLTTLNATAQVTLPPRLRARGMGCYLTMMAGSMTVGSLTWGRIADMAGITLTIQIAAGVMILAAITSLSFPLVQRGDTSTLDD